MAIDDVVSDYNSDSVADDARVAIRPADGDEWLLTMVTFNYGGVGWLMTSHTSTDEWSAGLWGGGTANASNLFAVGLHEIKFFLTYDEYVKVQNVSNGAGYFIYSAIKINE